jgi:hypothetical protein
MDDLLSLNFADAADEGATMTLVHPKHRTPLMAADGEPITIRLLGRDSDAFIAADRDAKNRNFENISEGAKLSQAELDLAYSRALAKCTVAWHGIPQHWIDNSGSAEPAECNPANALKLYENRGVRWVRDQADKFVSDRGNYLKA